MAIDERTDDAADPDLHMHLTSEHAGLIHASSLEELVAAHDYEHRGPCTIRNHPYESREYTARKALAVLIECLELRV